MTSPEFPKKTVEENEADAIFLGLSVWSMSAYKVTLKSFCTTAGSVLALLLIDTNGAIGKDGVSVLTGMY